MRATSPATVYAISSAGEVVRKIVVSAPAGTALPKEIRVAKKKLMFSFFRECDTPASWTSCRGTVYVVVDAATGQKLADYVAEGEVGGTLACYAPDPDRFFTFSITPAEHRLDIVEAAAG